jgi:hypothetical protein
MIYEKACRLEKLLPGRYSRRESSFKWNARRTCAQHWRARTSICARILMLSSNKLEFNVEIRRNFIVERIDVKPIMELIFKAGIHYVCNGGLRQKGSSRILFQRGLDPFWYFNHNERARRVVPLCVSESYGETPKAFTQYWVVEVRRVSPRCNSTSWVYALIQKLPPGVVTPAPERLPLPCVLVAVIRQAPLYNSAYSLYYFTQRVACCVLLVAMLFLTIFPLFTSGAVFPNFLAFPRLSGFGSQKCAICLSQASVPPTSSFLLAWTPPGCARLFSSRRVMLLASFVLLRNATPLRVLLRYLMHMFFFSQPKTKQGSNCDAIFVERTYDGSTFFNFNTR